jgi:cyclic pyranopterin phosphate synthase
VRVAETAAGSGSSPADARLCDDCNRVRLTCTGRLYLCLGQEDSADLRAPLRDGVDDAGLAAAVRAAVARKPHGHDFVIGRGGAPAVPRHMSVTGG